MKLLLLSMPDSFEHTPSMAMRFPNGALASIAGNIDGHHEVAIADLVLAQRSIPETITRLVREQQPDVVGLSVMTFQRKTACQIIRLIRALKPGVTVIAGGYDPSLATEKYETPSSGVDIIVRGEGDVTTRELLRALESGADLEYGARHLVQEWRCVRAHAGPARQQSRERSQAAEAGGARAQRLYLSRTADRRGRDLPRLHVRLQLLLDHRNARPQFPCLADRARD